MKNLLAGATLCLQFLLGYCELTVRASLVLVNDTAIRNLVDSLGPPWIVPHQQHLREQVVMTKQTYVSIREPPHYWLSCIAFVNWMYPRPWLVCGIPGRV